MSLIFFRRQYLAFPRHNFSICSKSLHTKGLERILTPKEFYKALNEHVIGQHVVKVALSVGMHNHLIRAELLKSKDNIAKATNESVTSADLALQLHTQVLDNHIGPSLGQKLILLYLLAEKDF